MTLSKLVTASLLGAMSFSSGALAKRHLNDATTDFDAERPSGGAAIDASALPCIVVAFASAEAIEEARAYAVAKTAEYMCGGEGTSTADEVAKATATGYALAVVSILDAVTANAPCFECENFAESWEKVSSDVILSAHSSVDFPAEEVQSTDARTKVLAIYEYYLGVEAAVAAAYAEAVAAAQTANGSAGCYSFEASPECIGQSYSSFNITQIPPLTIAVEEAVALTCSDAPVFIQHAYPTASALAQAIAEALHFVFSSCEVDNGSFICANDVSEVVATAEALAQEFAHSWSSGLICQDTCKVEVETATEAVASVLAVAVSDAIGTACASDASWTVEGIKDHIETDYLDSISQAIIFSIQSNPPGVCVAVTYASIAPGPTTALP